MIMIIMCNVYNIQSTGHLFETGLCKSKDKGECAALALDMINKLIKDKSVALLTSKVSCWDKGGARAGWGRNRVAPPYNKSSCIV